MTREVIEKRVVTIVGAGGIRAILPEVPTCCAQKTSFLNDMQLPTSCDTIAYFLGSPVRGGRAIDIKLSSP